MKNILLTLLRLIALVIIYLVLFTVASRLTSPPELVQRMTPEQVQQSMTALPLASLVMSLMLSYLAIRSRWHGWRLAGALFAILYILYAFLGWIELLAFPVVSQNMPAGMVSGLLVSGLILAIPFSLLAVWILGKARKSSAEKEANNHLQMPAAEWIWKIAAGAILYSIVYFAFGYYVAWRTPSLPEFYGGTDLGTFLGQLSNLARETPWLFALQIFRGLIGTGIGCLIVGMHKGKAWETILATGLTFTVVMNTSLLFPNPFMPPVVAHAHTVELVSSNFLYGILLSALLIWNPSRQEKPSLKANDKRVLEAG